MNAQNCGRASKTNQFNLSYCHHRPNIIYVHTYILMMYKNLNSWPKQKTIIEETKAKKTKTETLKEIIMPIFITIAFMAM